MLDSNGESARGNTNAPAAEILIAVYGSLRHGEFAFERHGKQRFVTHDVVEGYTLDDGYVPKCRRGIGHAAVEVYGVDLTTFRRIEAMEASPFDGGRHYFPVEVDTVSGHHCILWEYRDS